MRMMRCKGELAIRIPSTGLFEEFWPGKPVDFDRVLLKDGERAYTVADAVAGREDLFEPIPSETKKAAAADAAAKG